MAEASPKPINYWTFATGEMIVANDKFIVEVRGVNGDIKSCWLALNVRDSLSIELLKYFGNSQFRYGKVLRIPKLKTSF